MNRKDHHHLNLLCDIGELAALLAGSENIENFLQRTVEMVAQHMNANVCSIYLLDENSNKLVLKAVVGLNPAVIDKIRLNIGEGLVGMTFENLTPVNEGLAIRHPRFKNFSEVGEDSFDSFLAVPVQRGAENIGVLVVQHQEQNYFDEIDVLAMRAIASQLAGAVGNARLLIGHTGQSMDRQYGHRGFQEFRHIRGKVAALGYAVAPATVFGKSHGALVSVEAETNCEYTLADFHRAVRDTTDQLQELQSRFAQRLAESASLIFTAHLMILKDVRFISEMEKHIKSGISVPAAVKKVARHYINLLSDLALARDLNAEGIGLYRTEFPFLIRSAVPSEEEQFHVYKRLFDELAHDPKYIPFLLGIGIRALSVYPKFLPSVQKIICNLKLSDAKFYADQLLVSNSLKGTGEILQRLTETPGFNETGWRVEYEYDQ